MCYKKTGKKSVNEVFGRLSKTTVENVYRLRRIIGAVDCTRGNVVSAQTNLAISGLYYKLSTLKYYKSCFNQLKPQQQNFFRQGNIFKVVNDINK